MEHVTEVVPRHVEMSEVDRNIFTDPGNTEIQPQLELKHAIKPLVMILTDYQIGEIFDVNRT